MSDAKLLQELQDAIASARAEAANANAAATSANAAADQAAAGAASGVAGRAGVRGRLVRRTAARERRRAAGPVTRSCAAFRDPEPSAARRDAGRGP